MGQNNLEKRCEKASEFEIEWIEIPFARYT